MHSGAGVLGCWRTGSESHGCWATALRTKWPTP